MATPQRITKDGKVYFRVQIRRPSKGITLDEYFTSKRAADAFLRRVQRAIEDGVPITQNVRSRETFHDAAEAFLDDAASSKTTKGVDLKPSAKRSLHERVHWLDRELFGEVLLKHLDWPLVDAKLDEQTKARDWSSASRYRYETALSRLLDFCKRKGWVASNVLHGQQRLNQTNKRRRTFTDAEWTKLLEVADQRDDMLAMFLRLAWATGLRKSELQRLRWLDVEPIEHDRLGARIEVRDTKNHEDRIVFIDKDLCRLLEAHRQRFAKPTSLLVFPARIHTAVWSVDPAFSEARRAAKLHEPDARYGEVLGLHHVRHSWASRLGDRGASLAQMMSSGGWKTPGMVSRYMRRTESQSMEAATLLVPK